MTKKIKLSDAAKDLNVSTQEIIDYFAKKGDTKKKAATNLTETEMNLILEHYTKVHEVNSFDEYYKSKNEEKSENEDSQKQDKKNIKKNEKTGKQEEKKPSEQPKSKNRKNDKNKQQAKPKERGERSKLNVSFSSETGQTSTQRRTVDTRGSYVDLDKYNERYEQIAPTNKHKNDNYSSKKQKISRNWD